MTLGDWLVIGVVAIMQVNDRLTWKFAKLLERKVELLEKKIERGSLRGDE
jgi:hypothetical protein